MSDEIKKGLVLKAVSGEYTIISDHEIHRCKPRGLLRHHDFNIKAGDRVDFDPNRKTIVSVDPRKNDLFRPPIVNADKVFVVVSFKEPDLNLYLLDKMISVLEYNDIPIGIIFTKEDLIKPEEKEYFQAITDYYRKIGYDVYLSSRDCYDERILMGIEDTVCILTGQSGVGKSTLLNKFDHRFRIKTGEISSALGRGRHITRHTELYALHGGYLGDSPGFGAIDLDKTDELTFSQTFREFFEASSRCRYPCCLHLREPMCAVRDGVAAGRFLKSRYDNYLSFMEEVRKNKKRGVLK